MDVKDMMKKVSGSKVMLVAGLVFTLASAASEFFGERNKEKTIRELTERVSKLENK